MYHLVSDKPVYFIEYDALRLSHIFNQGCDVAKQSPSHFWDCKATVGARPYLAIHTDLSYKTTHKLNALMLTFLLLVVLYQYTR